MMDELDELLEEQTPALPGLEGTPDELTEAQLRSMAARCLFELHWGESDWMNDYFDLLAEGWSWRKAAYIVWACQPKKSREPRTQQAFAELIGLTSDRAIRTWREKNPAIEERIHTLTASALGKARAEVFAALIAAATNDSPRAATDRRTFLEMTGDYTKERRVRFGSLPDVLEGKSEEELRAIAYGGQGQEGRDG